jgi:SPP1 family predicted phage head-tail adaptor
MKKWPVFDPGDFMHPISIQQRSTAGAIGPAGPAQAWTEYVACYASIKHVRGTDVIRSGQDTAQLFATITIHYLPGIQQNMRVQDNNGNIYTIQTVENLEPMNVLLILNCIALGANDNQ